MQSHLFYIERLAAFVVGDETIESAKRTARYIVCNILKAVNNMRLFNIYFCSWLISEQRIF